MYSKYVRCTRNANALLSVHLNNPSIKKMLFRPLYVYTSCASCKLDVFKIVKSCLSFYIEFLTLYKSYMNEVEFVPGNL